MEDPSKYGVVVTDDSGKVERFVEKPKVIAPPGPFHMEVTYNADLKTEAQECTVPVAAVPPAAPFLYDLFIDHTERGVSQPLGFR